MIFDSVSTLGRPEAKIDLACVLPLIIDKRVFITGAGGFIGSHLALKIAELGPAHLTLLDQSEFNLYTLDYEFSLRHGAVSRREVLCDIRDARAMEYWFGQEKPDLVIHAAALKHVALGERQRTEYIRTNVLGTQVVADLCLRHDVKVMVLISTDKVVNAQSVLGATKKLAESYCQLLDRQNEATRFVCVRFGNVLGSTGSVAPLFGRQIRDGGPVTVTDPAATRYFMTASEAAALVLLGAARGGDAGAPRGCVYVLNMGAPIPIRDLAQRMIEAWGADDGDIKITYTGLQPGEKLTEELVDAPGESIADTDGAVSRIATPLWPADALNGNIAALARAAENFDTAQITKILKQAVPAFGKSRS